MMHRPVADVKKVRGFSFAIILFHLIRQRFAHFQRGTMLFLRKTIRAIGLVVVLSVAGACTLNTDVSSPGALLIQSGDEQTAAANTALPVPLGVIVVTQFGEPIKNATVTWSVQSGGGSLSASSTLSDDAGLTSVTYTTGPVAGPATIRAQVHGVPAVTFHATIN